MPPASGSRNSGSSRGKDSPRPGSGFKRTASSEAPVDRVPPHNIDAEQGLLASCIIGGNDVVSLALVTKLSPDYFYRQAHQEIFRAIIQLDEQQKPIDEILLAEQLQHNGQFDAVGGNAYLVELTNRIETSAHARHWMEIVREKYFLRKLIRTSVETIEKAFNDQDDLDHFLNDVEEAFMEISQDRVSDTAQPVSKSMDDAVQLVNRMIQNRGNLTGITSGFSDLDKMTYGFHPAEMIVVAARPGMGKTSIALNMIEAAIMPKTKPAKPPGCLMFSLEMSAEQLAMRLLCSRARVDMSKLRDGYLSADQQKELARTAAEFKKAAFWIDDSAGLNILELRAKARRLHNRHPLSLVVVDYLQLVSGTDARVPREQQIAEISRGMKAMSKELNLPVIVLAQLNRESEKEKRQPRASDLRESGSIEQDADVILLLSKARDSGEEEEQDGTRRCELIIAKQRNGPIGTVPLIFKNRITRFENFTPTSS